MILGRAVTTTVWSRAVRKTAPHAATMASRASEPPLLPGVSPVAAAGVFCGAWLYMILTPLSWAGDRYQLSIFTRSKHQHQERWDTPPCPIPPPPRPRSTTLP